MNTNIHRLTQTLFYQGFKYAGLQNSNQCFCGMTHGYYGKMPEDECNKKCQGDKEEICGAYYRNSVYILGREKSKTNACRDIIKSFG